MKLTQLLETKVETETGWAKLQPDGSMVVDNSGYKQRLSPQQVKAVWSGKKSIKGARYDGEYWDFGEELHIIPSREEFAPPRAGNEKLKVGMVVQFKGDRRKPVVRGKITDISGRHIMVTDEDGGWWELTSDEEITPVKSSK